MTRFQILTRGAAVVAIIAFALLIASAAKAQSVCGERTKFLKHLGKTYSEAPSALGITNNGQILELLRSKKGSWTILVTNAQGTTCMMAAGDAWEDVKTRLPKGPQT